MRPIRKAALFLLLSLLIPGLCATTAWADILDPCDSTSGPGSYQNLSAPTQNFIRWDNPPDRSYLVQKSNRQTATAVYRCYDAQEVTVAIYSRYGSYAGYSGGDLVRGGDALPLWYQSSTGEVYCDGRRMVYDAELRDFVFLEAEDQPSGLVEYGLSVYCSRDGSDYDKVSAQLISAWQEGPDSYWYEEYHAQLDRETRYLRLVLNDQSDIEILGRDDRYRFETTGGLSLASVEIIEGAVRGREEDEEDDWEAGLYWESDDWDRPTYDQNIWEAGEADTGALPSYQPGEEEGPASLPWGPEESRADDRPAFPEESGDPGEAPASEESASKSGASPAESPAASSKAPSQQKGSQPPTGQNGQAGQTGEEPAQAVKTGGPALRQEAPLWRRVTEPDAMTMLIISLILIVMGARLLWQGSGGNRPTGRGPRQQQEDRYARYTGLDRPPTEGPPSPAPPDDRGGEKRQSRPAPRRRQSILYDEGWEDPEP